MYKYIACYTEGSLDGCGDFYFDTTIPFLSSLSIEEIQNYLINLSTSNERYLTVLGLTINVKYLTNIEIYTLEEWFLTNKQELFNV